MRSKWRVSIGVVLMTVICAAAYISVNWFLHQEARPQLGALDCARGDDKITQTVCLRKYTWGLDRTLAQEYYAAITTASGEAAKALEQDHAEFVRRRAACFPLNAPAELKDVYRCVEDAYRGAISLLRAREQG